MLSALEVNDPVVLDCYAAAPALVRFITYSPPPKRFSCCQSWNELGKAASPPPPPPGQGELRHNGRPLPPQHLPSGYWVDIPALRPKQLGEISAVG